MVRHRVWGAGIAGSSPATQTISERARVEGLSNAGSGPLG